MRTALWTILLAQSGCRCSPHYLGTAVIFVPVRLSKRETVKCRTVSEPPRPARISGLKRLPVAVVASIPRFDTARMKQAWPVRQETAFARTREALDAYQEETDADSRVFALRSRFAAAAAIFSADFFVVRASAFFIARI